MEPCDLNPPPSDDPRLEAWLRANAALPPLPDDGFSPGVLARLPSPALPRTARRLLACAGGAAAGLLVAAWPLLAPGQPSGRLPTLDAALVHAIEQLTNPAAGLALLTTLGTLLYVFWRDLRRFVRL